MADEGHRRRPHSHSQKSLKTARNSVQPEMLSPDQDQARSHVRLQKFLGKISSKGHFVCIEDLPDANNHIVLPRQNICLPIRMTTVVFLNKKREIMVTDYCKLRVIFLAFALGQYFLSVLKLQ